MNTNQGIRFTAWVDFDASTNTTDFGMTSNRCGFEVYNHSSDPDENANLAYRAGCASSLVPLPPSLERHFPPCPASAPIPFLPRSRPPRSLPLSLPLVPRAFADGGGTCMRRPNLLEPLAASCGRSSVSRTSYHVG